ncbi:MAG: hypothetical protein QOH48_986 [Actinomycetota bacterium]|nr:hypothetical protein [Actinomycetota bacterium]
MTARMHVDELEIDEELVGRLLGKQFPEWAERQLRRLEPSGTVDAIFRLGDDLSVRLPRRDGPIEAGSKEFDWLPRLAPLLPVDVPIPVAQGRPGNGYPWFWEIHTWVEGGTVPVEEIDATQAARDLATFVAAMQQMSPTGAPPGRGISLAERDKEFQYWLARFKGAPAVRAEWRRAIAATPWDGPPVWHHGDLDARNWLVRDGRIGGVIDWGEMGVGDPACDVMVAWKLHSSAARDAFREACPPTRRHGSGRVAGLCPRRWRSSPTTHRRTTRISTAKPRAGSSWCSPSAISRLDRSGKCRSTRVSRANLRVPLRRPRGGPS